MSRFLFVSEHHDTYGVKRLCQVLGVSRSGYYAWTMRGPSAHAERDLELAAVVCEVHSRSRRTYGAPRVHAELGRLGHRTGRKRVARLMREYGLVGAHSRRKWRTGKPNTAWAPDLVERDFNPAVRDRVWAADVTQFRTDEGWLHFAGVIDLYSRRVIGWAMGNSPDADLVIDALVMAFERRRPDQKPIHHADRGAAYTSLAFGQQLERLGIAASFGSTGDAYDNAAVESTWSVLKRELAWIHGQHAWRTRALLRSAIFDYVEGFYNTTRIKQRLGYRSPAEFEQEAIA
ncbi:IS3 family transposase [Nocardioides piscis]|uniref:IS3 family transposase n=1 Tax=Nocardioides piscis TaxID=2714938 RepID=A0A6G7YF59_9ACTN|nr:IS3 family transposase [Nocardioides piscis]QIK75247.1 IS3 family transposase [Nocardioides piscis]